jgi:hypothetical protein
MIFSLVTLGGVGRRKLTLSMHQWINQSMNQSISQSVSGVWNWTGSEPGSETERLWWKQTVCWWGMTMRRCLPDNLRWRNMNMNTYNIINIMNVINVMNVMNIIETPAMMPSRELYSYVWIKCAWKRKCTCVCVCMCVCLCMCMCGGEKGVRRAKWG